MATRKRGGGAPSRSSRWSESSFDYTDCFLTITPYQPRERRRSRSPSRSPPRERRRSPSPRRHRSRSRSPRGDRSRSRSPRRMDVDDQDRDRDRDHRSHSSRPDRSTRYASTGGGGGRGPAYGGAPYNPARKAVSREIAATEAAKRSRKDCRVYVGNLAFGVKWNDLKDFMREGGSLSCRRRVGERDVMRLGRGKVRQPSVCKVRRAEEGLALKVWKARTPSSQAEDPFLNPLAPTCPSPVHLTGGRRVPAPSPKPPFLRPRQG